MKRTIYVRDADAPVWDKARQIAGEKLMSLIMEFLRNYVAQEESRVRESINEEIA